jgi:diguanylate cyclase (GGDEF)-like protein
VASWLAGLPKAYAVLLTVIGIALVAEVDFLTGVELRIYPLYYLPIAFAAWYLGRRWTVAAVGLSAAAWVTSNYLAGLHYSAPGIWLFNTVMLITSFLVVGVLLAQLKEALTHEKQLSRLDPLTSLMNARAFHEEAARILSVARRKKRPVTMAYIDLDDFKGVNDVHGHHEGDAMLRLVAGAILGTVRISDQAARMGGDEFVLLFPETGLAEARVGLDRLSRALGDVLESSPHPVTASIGAVVFNTVSDGVEAMIRAADRRMYMAKAAGKDRVVVELAEEAPAGAPVASRQLAE